MSSHDPRVVLGIGKRTKIDWLEVKWPEPSGTTERFTDLPIDKYITVVEGEGIGSRTEGDKGLALAIAFPVTNPLNSFEP